MFTSGKMLISSIFVPRIWMCRYVSHWSRPGEWQSQKSTCPYYNNRVYVRGHKYVLGPTQTYLSLRRAQNIFMPKNINSIAINITLEGIEKIKLKKMTTKHSEKYFFHQHCVKTSTNFEMASPFWLAV